MSEERLEEMNNKVTGLNDSDGDFTDEVKMSVDTYAWFYEQAERLHGTNHKMGYIDMYADCNRMVSSNSMEIHKLEQQNKRYREAIKKAKNAMSLVVGGEGSATKTVHNILREALEELS